MPREDQRVDVNRGRGNQVGAAKSPMKAQRHFRRMEDSNGYRSRTVMLLDKWKWQWKR